MPVILTSDQIGARLKQIRESRSVTQQELADLLKLPRTAVTQLESGSRRMTVEELQLIAQHFGVSLDAFVSAKEAIAVPLHKVKEKDKSKLKDALRISVAELNLEKFKTVLLYILEQCAGRPNVGDTVLRKLVYFSDFDHFELYETHLTGASYKRMPYGPVPIGIEQVLEDMISQGSLQRIKTTYYDHPQQRYIPLTKPDMTKMSAAERSVIDNVIGRFADWSAKALSEHSHNDIPWKATGDNQVIDYELVFYRDAPFTVRNYDNTQRKP